MKSEIVKILANTEGLKDKQLYNALLAEYSKEATVRQVYHYNTGFTSQKLESLVYELKKMYGITDKDIALLISKGSVSIDVEGKSAEEIAGELKSQSDLKNVNANADTDTDLILKQIPEDAKEGLKLREEYPFLNEANCPDALKILVADKISAYKNYAGLHAAALQAATEGEAEDKLYEYCSEAMKQWSINADIKAELDFYRNSEGKVLGNVDQTGDMKLQQEINEMTEAQLLSGRINAQKSVSKYKDNPVMHNKWKTRLELIEDRLVSSFKYDFNK